MVIVDGIHRNECLLAARDLVVPDGIVILDDAQRPEYASGVVFDGDVVGDALAPPQRAHAAAELQHAPAGVDAFGQQRDGRIGEPRNRCAPGIQRASRRARAEPAHRVEVSRRGGFVSREERASPQHRHVRPQFPGHRARVFIMNNPRVSR